MTRVVANPSAARLQRDEWPRGLVRWWPALRLVREVLTPREWRQEAGRRRRFGR